MSALDDGIFADIIFGEEGAVLMTWEVASRPDDVSTDSRQPAWDGDHPYGVIYAEPIQVVGLFRSQQRWVNGTREGQFNHSEASCSFPARPCQVGNLVYPAVQPGYIDDRVRDRFTVVQAPGDALAGRVFYPAGQASPFIFDGECLAWRVQLQGIDQSQREVPQ